MPRYRLRVLVARNRVRPLRRVGQCISNCGLGVVHVQDPSDFLLGPRRELRRRDPTDHAMPHLTPPPTRLRAKHRDNAPDQHYLDPPFHRVTPTAVAADVLSVAEFANAPALPLRLVILHTRSFQ